MVNENPFSAADTSLLTAGKIAEAVKASPAAVKKAILELKLKPDAAKGPCLFGKP